MLQMKQQFLGKTVQIFHGVSDQKFGEVLDINDAGVTFRITKVITDGWNRGPYSEGDIMFISFSVGLIFNLVK